MYAFLADKSRLYEGDVTFKSSLFLSKKKHIILYEDLFSVYNSNDLQKPITLLPNECLVSVNITEQKPTQVDLMFFGKTETYSLSFITPSADAARLWDKHLKSIIDPPELRAKKQIDYKDVLAGKFWDDVVGIALANRDRATTGPVPARHILLQGLLKKQSPKAVLGHRAWQSRIFVLHQDSLIYYKAKDEPPCGAIMLRDIVRINDHQTEPRMDIFIRIEDGAVRIMYLQAQSYEEIAIWIDRIQKAKTASEEAAEAATAQAALQAAQLAEAEADGDGDVDEDDMDEKSETNIRPQSQPMIPVMFSPNHEKDRENDQREFLAKTSSQDNVSVSSNGNTNQVSSTSTSTASTTASNQGGSRKGPAASQGPRNMRNALLDSDSDEEKDVQQEQKRVAPKPAHVRQQSQVISAASVNRTILDDDDDDDDDEIPSPPPRNTDQRQQQQQQQQQQQKPLSQHDQQAETESKANSKPETQSTSSTNAQNQTLLSNMRNFRSVLDSDEDDVNDNGGDNAIIRGVGQVYDSERKRRYQKDGFDLDLTYITNNIIVMGCPVPKTSTSSSSSGKSNNPNNLVDVRNFLEKHHRGKYLITNLAHESTYDQSFFDFNVRRYPMKAEIPPPFRVLIDYCIDIAGFLFANPDNVVVIHCSGLEGVTSVRTGSANQRKNIHEGRTMLLAACLLLFIRHPAAQSAQSVVEMYVTKRLHLQKSEQLSSLTAALVLMSPSQIRWLRLFERHMREYFWRGVAFPAIDKQVQLHSIRLFPAADFDIGGGCDPYVVIRPIEKCSGGEKKNTSKSDSAAASGGSTKNNIVLYNSHLDKEKNVTHKKWNGDKPFVCEFSAPISIQGEVEVLVYDKDLIGSDLMFRVCLQTTFIGSTMLLMQKQELDYAAVDWRCEHFPEDFTCMLEFTPHNIFSADSLHALDNPNVSSSAFGNGDNNSHLQCNPSVAINDLTNTNNNGYLAAEGVLVFPPVEASSLDLKAAGTATAQDTLKACGALARILPSHCKPKNKKEAAAAAATTNSYNNSSPSNGNDTQQPYGSANLIQLRRLGVNIEDMEEEEELHMYSDSEDDDDYSPNNASNSQSSRPASPRNRLADSSDSDSDDDDNVRSQHHEDDEGVDSLPPMVSSLHLAHTGSSHDDDRRGGPYSTSPVSSTAASPTSQSQSNSGPNSVGDDDKKKTAWSIKDVARKLVSKKKKRFQENGYNLDLTYIAPTIIAMGYPSEGIEAAYRNRMSDVQRFLQEYHGGHYKVYNLCSERGYNPDRFQKMARYPFDDHNPCSIQMLYQFCQDAGSFLQSDPENVVAIHCKAGKGRTGLMIAALLIYMQAFDTSLDALRFYGHQRTANLKGVTIPSQQRFVTYFEMFMKHYHNVGLVNAFPFRGVPIVIKKIILRPFALFDRTGGCDPYVVISDLNKRDIYNHKKATFALKQKIKAWKSDGTQPEAHIDLLQHVEISTETKFTFYDYDMFSKSEKMFHFWIHPVFMYGLLVGATANQTTSITLTKPELDKAVKDRKCTKFPADFSCEIVFSRPEIDHNGYY